MIVAGCSILRHGVIGIIVAAVYWLATFSSLLILTDHLTALFESTIVVATLYFGSKIVVRLSSRVFINVGGFFVPMIISVEMLVRTYNIVASYPQAVVVPVFINIVIAYLSSYVVVGHGVIVRFLPPIIGVSSAIALVLSIYNISPYYSLPLSIVIGYVSTLFGADILGYRGSREKLIFGGGGFYDALVVIPLFSPGISYGLTILSMLVMK